MAASESSPQPTKAKLRPGKLPKLPSNSRVQKRPLHHPPVSSSRASSSTQKIIYVSSKTPFMSAVQRIRINLIQISKRKSQSINDTTHSSTSKGAQIRRKAGGDRILAQAMEEIERAEKSKGEGEEVVVKGTGKAIEKVMGIAGFFQENAITEGVQVRLTTGSVWAIDDISVSNEEVSGGEQMDVDGKEEEDIPETRVRQVSVLEVRIGLR
ncbi:putative ribonuclease p mrp subunit pop7 protein [Venturia nashicola]|uniref:Putative ribonuclease p mrp subunit pop7 protein n=1 Tax=Venturia nashicola TaxID=86259 RepID=A0A4Z1NZB7_9PEZI|nr:putative ribonuclease p mrp subunit pop7 protein [Venturia nashicola]